MVKDLRECKGVQVDGKVRYHEALEAITTIWYFLGTNLSAATRLGDC